MQSWSLSRLSPSLRVLSVVEYSNEFEFIRRLREHGVSRPEVLLGIGDDAAVVDDRAGHKTLLCTDTLMEGVHFTRETATPSQIGRKALAVNLSDIAAMGGVPQYALVSVCVPKGSSSILNELYRGLWELADEFDVAVVGGDTNSWNGPLIVSVTLTGVLKNREPITRSGANKGDGIMVTGTLGGSLQGKHLDFVPRVQEAQEILEIANIHSMIDISDGLTADLAHILEESHLGAELWAEKIPLSEAAKLAHDGRSPLDHALNDGEDFELLFTLSVSQAENLLVKWNSDVPITQIGEIVENKGIQLQRKDGTTESLSIDGWKHEF